MLITESRVVLAFGEMRGGERTGSLEMFYLFQVRWWMKQCSFYYWSKL